MKQYEWIKLGAEAVLCVALLVTALLGFFGDWSSLHTKALINGIVIVSAFTGLAILGLISHFRLRRSGGLESFQQIREHDADRPHYERLQSEYLYIGQTFHLNVRDLLDILDTLPRGVRLRLLLTDLRDEETVETLWAMAPDGSRDKMIERLARQQFETASALVDVANLEIRLYRRGIPFWSHSFDGSLIIFGLLRAKTPGADAPAVELRPVSNQFNLHSYFAQLGEVIWQMSEAVRPADLVRIALNMTNAGAKLAVEHKHRP